jgi:MFS family permease
MLLGAFLTFIISFASAFIQSYPQLVLSWACFGFASTFISVPIGQLLRSETNENDRTAIFGAQFSLSHACWLITYPLLGYLLVLVGLKVSFLIIAGIVLSSTLIAWFLWFSPKGTLFS